MKFDNLATISTEAKEVQLPFGPTIATFLVKYCDTKSPAYTKVRARLSKPYRRLIEANALPDDRDREIAVKTFVECCVVGWSGVKSDGEDVPYSQDACCDLLIQSPPTFYDLVTEAQELDNFKPSKDDAKN